VSQKVTNRYVVLRANSNKIKDSTSVEHMSKNRNLLNIFMRTQGISFADAFLFGFSRAAPESSRMHVRVGEGFPELLMTPCGLFYLLFLWFSLICGIDFSAIDRSTRDQRQRTLRQLKPRPPLQMPGRKKGRYRWLSDPC